MGAVHILVASYLYSIVEPKVEGLKWETMLVENHKRADRLSSRLRITYPITISIYAVFSIVCVFFSWLFLKDYRILNVLLYSCVTVILGVCFVVVSVYALHVSSNKYRSESVSRWKKIEEDLYPAATSIRMNS